MNLYVLHRRRKTAASFIAYLQKKNLILFYNSIECFRISNNSILCFFTSLIDKYFSENNFFNIFDLS